MRTFLPILPQTKISQTHITRVNGSYFTSGLLDKNFMKEKNYYKFSYHTLYLQVRSGRIRLKTIPDNSRYHNQGTVFAQYNYICIS